MRPASAHALHCPGVAGPAHAYARDFGADIAGTPYWAQVCDLLASGQCEGCCSTESEQKLGLKHEELGYVGDEPPTSDVCNRAPCKAPTPAKTVRAFLRVFLAKNELALLELERRIHAGLRALPAKYHGDNGRDFLKPDMMKKTFCYAYIQVRTHLITTAAPRGSTWA